ncbi:zonular occludens toxin domain-containing protein [Variovorax saccharolyticus]|uniref:zonular occludens toxin domain-containing protein n=1 Tax=Variovorax saccharolyticus TaxID=3053516 RepID=UPI002578D62B|nr:zonular occludens toxin domain-containing protein [Variovorax sp. J31P216]MDM0027767.1 zonular occludens toxin domain-containing protein [Variovorax sp. J31P216]
MPVFSVEGKLGTGKTKFCIWRAQQAIIQGRKVASNVDIAPHLITPRRQAKIIRIPDKPKASDLDAIGHGNPDSYDEDKNGVLILDELGTWLNSRSFQDKDRAPLLDWLIHARKHGWDVYLIVQDANMIDRQVREALIEYQIRCMRMDRVRIPILGHFTGLIRERWAYLPKFHLATSRVGIGQNAVVAERWQFVGKSLHACYDTRQIFREDYDKGTHSVLPPWDWSPAPMPGAELKERVRKLFSPPVPPRPQPKPKDRVMALIATLPEPQRIVYAKRWLHALS